MAAVQFVNIYLDQLCHCNIQTCVIEEQQMYWKEIKLLSTFADREMITGLWIHLGMDVLNASRINSLLTKFF